MEMRPYRPLIRVSVFFLLTPAVLAQPWSASETPAAEEAAVDQATTAYAPEARDGIDASGPSDSKAAKRLQLAEGLLAAQRWDRAQETLLYVLDHAEGALVRRADGTLVPVVEEANRLLGRLPPDVLELYRRQYDRAAEMTLKEGVTTGRHELIEQVADQFRHTEAGEKALLRLASLHFDRGQFGLALRRYRQLGFERLQPVARVRAAYALAEVGDVDEAEKLLESLTDFHRETLAAHIALDSFVASAGADGDSIASPDDWRMPFGDATSTVRPREGEPTLLRRWFQPLTHRLPLRERAERASTDLRDSGRSPVPVAIPLAIGDRVLTRTLEGVRAYSAKDGRLLWETEREEAVDAESRFASARADQFRVRQAMQMRAQFGIDPSRIRGNADPLASLLYRNGVTGLISADSDRLYVVEGHPSGAAWASAAGWNGQVRGTVAGQGSSPNRLIAYDLKSGRQAWSRFGGLGGLLDDGPFEVPLAGYYFFGPPTPVGGQLYVVAEKDGQIELISLDPASGFVRWRQLIAYAQIGIESDPVRGFWPAAVAVADGVLVCPTTVGWLVGVDQSTHSILWAYRYAPVQAGRNSNDLNPAANLAAVNDRWTPTAPMIYDGKVYFTPSEEPRLVCLDLATGELLWQRGKGSYLYTAGISDDVLIVVGNRSVEGLSLSNGVVKWTARIPEDMPRPSGRGVLSRDRLYLPLHDRLWELDIAQGSAAGKTSVPERHGPLGNLVLQGGKLISVSAEGTSVFEERTQLVQSIEERLQAETDAADALFQKAKLLQADGDLPGAVAALDRVPPEQREQLSDQHRQLRWDLLVSLARADAAEHRPRIDELSQLAKSVEERLLVRRLRADAHASAGEVVAATRDYLELAAEADPAQMIVEDADRRSVRFDAWLAGKLETLWANAGESSREEIDATIDSWLERMQDPAAMARASRVLAFHPVAGRLEHDLAKAALAEGRPSIAELHLLRSTRLADESAAATAYLDLAGISNRFKLGKDAEYWLGLTAEIDQELILPDGQRFSDRRAAMLDDSESEADSREHWGSFRFDVVRSGSFMSVDSSSDVQPLDAVLPFYRDRLLRLLPQHDRLTVSGSAGSGLEQLVPLRTLSRSSPRPTVVADGHTLFVVYRGVLQAISLLEGRLLWSTPLPDEALARNGNEQPPAPMRPGGSFVGMAGLSAGSRERGIMPFAGAAYVAIRGRRELTVFNSVTGEIQWTRNDVPADAEIIGTNSRIYLMPRGDGRRTAFRVTDGEQLDDGKNLSRIPHAIAAIGDDFVTVTTEQSLRLFDFQLGGGTSVARYRPDADQPIWQHQFPNNALFDLVDRRLYVLTPDSGELVSIDLATGEKSLQGRIPKDVLVRRSEVVLLADRDMIYVLVNSGRAASNLYSADLPAITANGDLFALKRGSHEIQWRHAVDDRRLLFQSFDHLPVLLLINSERVQKGTQPVWRVDLLALDKRTGEAALDEPFYTLSSPYFRKLTVQPERRLIELSAYSTRVRLQAVPKEDAAPAGEPEPAQAN